MEEQPISREEQSRIDSEYHGEGFWDRVEDIGGLIAAGGLSTRRREKAAEKREEQRGQKEQRTPGTIGGPIGSES